MDKELTIEMLRKYSNALHTQYQLHGDYSISGRASYEAPTIEQMSTIREAHLAIIPIVKQLIATMQREAKLREALEEIAGISNEDYKTGGFLCGEIPGNWMEDGYLDAKSIAMKALTCEYREEMKDE